MSHMMKKADFLKLVENKNDLKIVSRMGAVFLYNADSLLAEIYRASNMKEEGIICGMNQAAKYRKWLGM